MLGSLMSFFSAEENSQQIDTHWMSESGIIDVFILLGPKSHDVFKQYAALTGTTTLPPVSNLSSIRDKNTRRPCTVLALLKINEAIER